MSDKKVYRMQHIALREGAYHQAVTDLIFRNGLPVAVLRWGGDAESEFPLVSQRLDPAKLREFRSGDIEYLYDDPIEVPILDHEAPE